MDGGFGVPEGAGARLFVHKHRADLRDDGAAGSRCILRASAMAMARRRGRHRRWATAFAAGPLGAAVSLFLFSSSHRAAAGVSWDVSARSAAVFSAWDANVAAAAARPELKRVDVDAVALRAPELAVAARARALANDRERGGVRGLHGGVDAAAVVDEHKRGGLLALAGTSCGASRDGARVDH